MSAERKVEPNFDQAPELWTEEPPTCLGPESLIYEEETTTGGLLVKSGLVVLLALTVFGGYQFLGSTDQNQHLASSQPLTKKDNSDLPAVNAQGKPIRKIDLTQTGSIKKPAKAPVNAIGKPVPIKSASQKPSANAEFYVIQPGDTLSAIGRKFKVSAAHIMEVNAIEDARRIKPGMKLIVSK